MNQAQKPETDHPPYLTLQTFTQKLNELSILDEAQLQLVELDEGEVLFNQGDPGDSVYLLVAGVLGVRQRHADGRETIIDKLAPGAIVGELAPLSGQERSATVFAVNRCGLLRLSKSELDQLSQSEKENLVDMQGTVVDRWRRLQLSKALNNLFGEIDVAELHALQEELVWRHLSNGDILFQQGDWSDGMYIVLSGRLRFTATDEQGNVAISGEVGVGEPIGEFALITQEKRSATVYAVRETNLVKITPEHFTRLAQRNPRLMTQLTRIIINRQQRSLGQARPISVSQLTIAIIPITPGVKAARFAHDLAAAMQPYGQSLTLDANLFNERAGHEGAAQAAADSPNNLAVASLFDELEANYTFLLYVADGELTPWTRRCVGQADRILLLAAPDQSPQPGAVEEWLGNFDIPIRTELVLWHTPETGRPQGTAAWLDNRSVYTHHHVRQNTPEHIRRLARRLTGHAVGLALSGGAARGYVHLGVHRALEELNIPIDYIGAASMGALIGGAITVSETHAELMQTALSFADPKMIFDRTLPLTAMMTSRKVTNITKQVFGERLIEDSWIPYFCVASNLTTAEPIVYQRGPMWPAVRASISIPGVFAPVMQDGDALVDGGVIDNFPVETLANLCESDRIIGVNVSPHREKKRSYDYKTDISGWRIFLSRLNPFSKSLRAPSLLGVIMRTFEINSVRRAKEQEALVDVMIYPDARQFKTTAYEACEAIAQVGYEAAIEPLTEWKKRRFSSDDGSYSL